MKSIKYVVAGVMLLALLCGSRAKNKTPQKISKDEITPPEDRTSIFALIIDPEAYNEQTVTVRGAFYLDGDGAALYATPDDGEYLLTINALWMGEQETITAYTAEELKALDGEYVEVTGTVVGDAYGPEEAYNCELKDIQKILKLEPVNELPKE